MLYLYESKDEFVNMIRIAVHNNLPSYGVILTPVANAQYGSLQFDVERDGELIFCFNFNIPTGVKTNGMITGFNSRYIPDEEDPGYGEPNDNDFNIQMGGEEKSTRADHLIDVNLHGFDNLAVSPDAVNGLIGIMVNEVKERIAQRAKAIKKHEPRVITGNCA